MTVGEIPWNNFQPISALLYESAGLHSLCRKCDNPIWNTKNNVRHYIFSCIKERLTHPKHYSTSSSKLGIQLWDQLFWSVLSLDNMCPPRNICNSTADFMAPISKRMLFSPGTHESRVKFIVLSQHVLTRHIDRILVELVCHIFFMPPSSASYVRIYPHNALPCLYI